MKFFKLNIFILLFISALQGQEIPSIGKGIYLISEYVASEKFCEIKKSCPGPAQVDSIFNYCKKIYGNDYSDALLAATFALLPSKKLKVMGELFTIPLPGVNDSLFNKKNKNLPKYFLPDSPQTPYGDRDKLTHFFGSAFLSYNFGFFNISEFIGIFIELFQNVFNRESRMDKRDIAVNRLGSRFGKMLSPGNKIVPSQIFLDMNK